MTNMSTALPRPQANGDSRPYWNAARERRLLIRKCNACGLRHFMPRHQCPRCWSEELEWVESEGRGSIHSFSIVHRAPTSTFAANTPYVIALVDLDEGPRMFANVVGNRALDVAIGDRVSVTFEDRGDGALVPQFTLARD
ncbi:MAG TPA: Zn-ribbon domain-containing OB-fold protein [Burkholderiales bacterium]|nr:Zn-ribbon domain-containing OB-fold protein [Burkholderiales bacterium]